MDFVKILRCTVNVLYICSVASYVLYSDHVFESISFYQLAIAVYLWSIMLVLYVIESIKHS